MDFLKKIFGSGSGEGSTDGAGMYFYVRPKGCDEVIRVRVDRNNDLSINDDEGGYWVRKLVRGNSYKCMQVEMQLYFDTNRNLRNSEVNGGSLVSEKEFETWTGSQQSPS